MRLSRCEVRDHINYRKNDRWPSYRFYSALQRQKSPMRYICEIFGAPRFSSFSTQSTQSGRRKRVAFVSERESLASRCEASTLLAATSIRRGLAAAHGHELFLTKSENEPCGLIETVCELSVVRIHHLSSFRLRRRSQRRDYLQTRHT